MFYQFVTFLAKAKKVKTKYNSYLWLQKLQGVLMDGVNFKELLWFYFWWQAFFSIIFMMEKCVYSKASISAHDGTKKSPH